MSSCRKCDEHLDGTENCCPLCGAPPKPRTAAGSFNRSAREFKNGLNGLLDLMVGCPESLAEDFADGYDTGEISATAWGRRFEAPCMWLKNYFYRLVMSHFDITESDLKQFIDEIDDETETSKTDIDALSKPTNGTCACEASLTTNPPTIIIRWKVATESTAVCFDCFGQISTRIDVSEQVYSPSPFDLLWDEHGYRAHFNPSSGGTHPKCHAE